MIRIGVDLGGTNIAVGAVSESGMILAEASVKTLPQRPYQEVIRDMGHCVLKAIEKAGKTVDDVCSVGVGVPGIADHDTGRVIFCPNIFWKDVPLRDELQKYIDKPVYIDNDATVAGFAESVAGVSKGCDSSVFLTLGTGVGGGIVLGGRPYSGVHGVGSEIGHMIIVADGDPCNCGNKGCAERYCSATAIIRMAKKACETAPDSLILKKASGDVNRISAKLVIDAAKENDPTAVAVFSDYVKYLSITIANLIQYMDPEMIVLGGGVSHAGNFLLDAVRKQVPSYLIYKNLPHSRIELASLGNEAGIIGAAFLDR